MNDPLHRLVTVRQHAVERARVALAAALHAEAEADRALRATVALAGAAQTAMPALLAEAMLLAPIAAQGRDRLWRQAAAADQACASARMHVERCRFVLAAARIDAAAVAAVIDDRRKGADAAAERAAQTELEDVDRAQKQQARGGLLYARS
jgi:hypothetical protein